MSRENVEVVLAFTNAYNASDLATATADLCASDVTVRPDAAIYPEAGAGALVGSESYRRLLEDAVRMGELHPYP